MMFPKTPQLIRFCCYLFIIALGLLGGNFEVNVVIATAVFLALVYEGEWRNGVHMMFIVAFSTFVYLPAIVAAYFSEADFSLFYLTAICSFVFIFKTRGLRHSFEPHQQKSFASVFYFISLLIVALSLAGYYYVYSLWGPFVMFFALNLRQESSRRNTCLLGFFMLVFAIYSSYGWNGFGRTVTLGFLMCGILYYLYAQNYRIPKLVWAIIPGLGSTLLSSRSLANLEFVGFEEALKDSAFGPYILASTFINYFNSNGYDFAGFMEDVAFTAFSFVPREIWPSKPYGFGFEFVVRHMDAYLEEAGHSVASTMIGDHLYYLGYLGVVTALLMTRLVGSLCIYLYKLKRFHGFGVVIMSCYMLVFVWGGMSSLSARLIFPFSVFFGYVVAMKMHRSFRRRRFGKSGETRTSK